jgi:hypothetical protein
MDKREMPTALSTTSSIHTTSFLLTHTPGPGGLEALDPADE